MQQTILEVKPLAAAEERSKTEKAVKYYRHKLQKGFLSRATLPNDEELKFLSSILRDLEEAHPDLEGSVLRATKICKVLRHILRLPYIPLDEVYGFRVRCMGLVAGWYWTLEDDCAVVGEVVDGVEDSQFHASGDGGEGGGMESVSKEFLSLRIVLSG